MSSQFVSSGFNPTARQVSETRLSAAALRPCIHKLVDAEEVKAGFFQPGNAKPLVMYMRASLGLSSRSVARTASVA